MNRSEIEQGWLKNEPESVRRAAFNLLVRMSGCPDADCHACRGNREEVEVFLKTIRENA